MIASVVLDIKNSQLNKAFEYVVPKKYEDIICPGIRVFAPFGKRNLMGIVIELKEEANPEYKLKEIISLLDIEPVLSEEMILLGKKLSAYYYSFLIENYFMMIPNSLKGKYVKIVDFTNYDNSIESINVILNGRTRAPLNDFVENLKDIKHLKERSLITITNDFEQKGSIKYKKIVYVEDESLASTSKQKEIIKYLLENNGRQELSILVNDLGYSASTIKTMIKNNVLRLSLEEDFRSVKYTEVLDKKVILNDEQKLAFNQIKGSFNKFDEFLIKGICGSGKTEIYLNLIEETLNLGKQAIMLVPEISLTPQMASRFKARFGNLVAIMHSRLSDGERFDEWRKIKNNTARIVVGPRSALFVPMNNIGIIILDEEHSESYIQDTNPRYDAHYVAALRAQYHNCPLVYGSATPLVTTYYNANEGKLKLIELKKRANNRPLPISFIVDMKDELKAGCRSVISRPLKEALIETFNKNEQAVLLINRRGYSTFVMCRSCGEEVKCPHCDISLTYHKSTERLVCHYCGYQTYVPSICPKCGSRYIRFLGDGTQKLEEEITNLLPEARVIRMDSDSTSKKNAHDEIITKFLNHEADILLGTQVVAKGLDFPLVSLVGIVNADLGLKMPFYDSFEKTYDLLEQASGRAGRKDTDGKVIIQTYNPLHIAIRAASVHNYNMFYDEEIIYRKRANNPPFTNMIEILVYSIDKNKAFSEINNIKNALLKHNEKIMILGPIPNYIFKIKDKFIFQMIIRMDEEDISVLSSINESFAVKKDVFLQIKRM